VAADSKIAEFIGKALAAGISQESVVGMLAARGWPEKDVYEALAEHYQRSTGLEIPRRGSSGASAREAFFYLLIFAALATWTIGFGALAFALIEYWFADPLFRGVDHSWGSDSITYSLATLIIAFPLYLLVSRTVVRESAAHPEKLDSSIRKWLTYMALVIAACVFTGDLITALAYLLRGEFTSRFLAKSLVVLLLSGGVFFYYFGGLRKIAAGSANETAPVRWNRDRVMAILSSAFVVILVILGFSQSGPPRSQRDLRADAQRISALYQISTSIAGYYGSHSSQLPPSLDQLNGQSTWDPITHMPYEYHPGQGSQYELCATFNRKSDQREANAGPNPWIHPAGRHCFSIDATAGSQFPQQYFLQ
jgi:hypothetical protein